MRMIVVFKTNQRIWLKILYDIAKKLATGDKTISNFDENLEKLKF